MRTFFLAFFISLLCSLSSCRKDFVFEPSTGELAFSKDTVYLDTVFSNIGSSTYSLKVYNKSNKDIKIPTIRLKNGATSKYRISVDGMTGVDGDDANTIGDGKLFNNVELLAKDSLYIFIETTADIKDADPKTFLYTDQIQLGMESQFQTVELVTLIQDAVFLYPQRFIDDITKKVTYESIPLGEDAIYGFVLDHNDHDDEYHFTNKKPYVIYGYAAVPEGETLTVDAGARVHFHDASGIIVGHGGSLKINGGVSTTKFQENEVIFEGDRLEPEFADTPGQWGLVWLSQGSINNEINHLTLKNATVGLLVTDVINTPNPILKISNSQFYNCSNMGILARTATIEGQNLAINSAGQYSLACTEGGNYTFTHCTFNNNWQSSKQLAVLVNNFKQQGETVTGIDLAKATFNNCIIYGTNQIEFLLDKTPSALMNYQLNNCLIKFNTTNVQLLNNPLFQFKTDTDHYSNIILNQDPNFQDDNKNKLNIDGKSPAFAKGNETYLIPTDVLGVTRTLPPDLGAFQSAPFVIK